MFIFISGFKLFSWNTDNLYLVSLIRVCERFVSHDWKLINYNFINFS